MMKRSKLKFVIPLAFVSAITASFCAADSLEITFSDEAEGIRYKLFRGDYEVCDKPISEIDVGPEAMVMDCEDNDIPIGTHIFTLIAVRPDNSDSPRSPEYDWTRYPDKVLQFEYPTEVANTQ